MSYCDALSEEIEVLKSIYDNDLKYDGAEIIITLFPLQEKEKMEIYTQLDLCISCPDSYPEVQPELSLKNIKGLSNNLIAILYSKLKEMAKSKVGEVMIYNLAYFVQEFLSEHNKPGKKSCYEEMIRRKELQKQEEYKSEVNEKSKLIKNIQEKQKEMLSLTEHDSSDCGDEEEEEEEDDEEEKVSSAYSEFCYDKFKTGRLKKDEIQCEHKNCKYMQFNNKVLRGSCIEHNASNTIYCAIDSMTGDQLLLQEWILKPKSKNCKALAAIRQKLEVLQSELGSLKKICHENLISYIDFKWSFEKGDWFVYVLQEYVNGCNLTTFIDRSTDLDINFIRHILSGILNGLDHLHSHGIIHGSFNESSVYFTKLGNIKIGNYGIKKIVNDLHESLKCEPTQLQRNPSQKSDILEVGYMILKVMKLSLIPHSNIMVPDFQPVELKDFIEKCLIENEESRWTARKLLNHKFIKGRERKLTVIKKKLSNENDSEMNDERNCKSYTEFFEGNQNMNSRLAKDFKILNHLGSGSFGRVLKVKNNLDGSIYAIKAIRLNMKNKQLDKKMLREVKLLSKLNHENVVRYYTSWIEIDSNTANSNSADKESDEVDSKTSAKINRTNEDLDSEDENDDDEDDDEDEEDEDETDNKEMEKCLPENEKKESSFIVFLGNRSDNILREGGDGYKICQEQEENFIELNRTMYIQMEFCEKSTLRIAINETDCIKLCDDEPRLWRLFREIVEGLAYVHGQGMIHRDLKPENIFIDSSDHVKIGDFGLATISAVSKSILTHSGPFVNVGDHEASSQNIYDDFHTGRVGTSLYVAPELDKTYEKSYYNEKVDIYSLGILFFEMCNGPFGTDMERIETLLNIRKFEIILPCHWEGKPFKQKNLVKMLLNHDPKSRPSCQEILGGDYLPPAEFEYEQFQDILRQTLTNPKSKAYKYLVSSCFDQDVRIEDDITYQWENVRSEKQHFILDLVKERMENILKRHGAIYLPVPLLLPQNKENTNVGTRVQLMTHSGSIVNLPYDLRVSFARYLACRAFTRLRRYVVERVYKEKKVHGLHPKEQYECAFDLVTPSSDIENAKLEILSLIQEVINDFKPIKNRNCLIRLNHSLLLKALLIHFNSEKWYSEIFKILTEAKDNKYIKSKVESQIQILGIQIRNVLMNLLTKEDTLNNIKKELFFLINKRGKALDMLNQAFEQLNAVIVRAERLGIEVPIKIALGVVCNSEYCSDMMFDVVFKVKQKRKKEETVILMSGCRYDGLISNFRFLAALSETNHSRFLKFLPMAAWKYYILIRENKFRLFFEHLTISSSDTSRRLFELTASTPGDYRPSAVGVSIYLDKIAAVLKEDNILSEYVVICSFGNHVLMPSKDTLARKMWESGIRCYVEQTIETLEELTDYCRENKITHIVNMKDEESGFVYVMTWDNDKNHYVEKKINVRELIEHILKYSKTSEGSSSPALTRYFSEPQNKAIANDSLNGNQCVNVHIVSDDKLTTAQRRRWESQLRTRITSVVGVFSSRTRVEVLGVFLDERKIKELALNFKTSDSSDNFLMEVESSWKPIKQYMGKICLKLRHLFSDNSNAVIILYSLPQDKYHFILHC